MKNNKSHKISLTISLIVFFFTASSSSYSQGTWNDIHTIFQTSCAGASCHSSNAPHPLKLIGSSATVYNNLVNVTPVNQDASTKGYKLVDPGHPHLSFLLKKVNNGLDPDNDMDNISQGGLMPSASPALTNQQIELINAWILHGAPETGNVVNQQIIADYYNGMGLPHAPPPPAPNPADGFQIHMGPIFVAPGGDEKEFFKKHKISNIPDSMEITRIETFIDVESHHYIIYKFDSQADADAVAKDGLREVIGLGDAFVNGTSMVAAWQNTSDIVLPYNTAYFWEGNPTLDLNLHIRNYSLDSVLKTDVYSNVYLRPKQNATIEMFSDLTLFSVIPTFGIPCALNQNPFCIPADGLDYTFTGDVTDQALIAGPNDSMYVWLLSSHTHKFGVGYNIYTRNPGGGIGQQVYDGFYNFDYTAYQGFYDFEDPAVKYFDPDTFVVAAQDGFIHEATFNNNGSTDVGFGLTTNDEMMLMFLQYTLQPPKSTIPTTPPVAAFNAIDNGGGDMAFIDQSANFPTTWSWDFGDANTSTAQNPSNIYVVQDMSYYVCLNVTNLIGSDTFCDSVFVGAGAPININELDEMTINVVPNPSYGNSEITFVRSYIRENELIIVYNLLGEKITTLIFPNNEKEMTIEKTTLKPGVYIYKSLANNKSLYSGKLIIY